MWPNARISVMGGAQAASTLLTVRMQPIAKKSRRVKFGRADRVYARFSRSTNKKEAPILERAAVG